MNKEQAASSMRSLAKKAFLKLASIRDFTSDTTNYQQAFTQADGIFFDTLKIAVVNAGNEEQVNFMIENSAAAAHGVEVEPERFHLWDEGSNLCPNGIEVCTNQQSPMYKLLQSIFQQLC